jgi:hypothetical protein
MTTNGILTSIAKASFFLGSAQSIATDLASDKEKLVKCLKLVQRQQDIAKEQGEQMFHSILDRREQFLSSKAENPADVRLDELSTEQSIKTL